MNRLVDIFRRGGPVMWPILALSVLGLAILIWKAFEFRRGRRGTKGLAVVSTIITAEPMLGILGTVTGIMQTFSAMNSAPGGTANPLAATAGIGEALTTTAAGLVASLILLFPYNWLDAQADEDAEDDDGGGDDGGKPRP